MKNLFKVLIVEDEVLIARSLERYLKQRGYEVAGIAISYEEAIVLYKEQKPDLSLLDIRLNGEKSGIDVAHFINEQKVVNPFMFLTSQIDRNNIASAKETFPAGYLTKPVQKNSLYANIEVVKHKYLSEKEEHNKHNKHNKQLSINVFDGFRNHQILVKDLLFLQAEHVYVKLHLKSKEIITARITLKELLSQLPSDQFIKTHRSFAVNIQEVQSWDNEQVYFDQNCIPISRSRKKKVQASLKQA